jgi:predicted CXXCH cytochrome family protein
MQPASEATVLGKFDNAVFSYFGRTTRFSRSAGSFEVVTENQRGETQAFAVAYTLGYEPLQQYLVQFDDGRIQALPFAWDSRARDQGGQRWFHLYPDADVKPGDPLFWTRPQQNWNHMCGDCHTTGFAKNFSDAGNRFQSSWSEVGNGCESCHGAGSAHAEAMLGSPVVRGPLHINPLRDQGAQLDQCGACHSRRVRLHEDPSREKMLQTWRPELLVEGLYFVDGQIRDEVFEAGSFLQSKMAAMGVTCTDCHDPHTGRLKAEGNGLCTQCHDIDAYDTANHHFHPAGSSGAQCVNCHMPTRTYMVVDARRDHRLSVPRPGESALLGTPNACIACHDDRTNEWASAEIRQFATRGARAPMQDDTFGVALWQARNEQSAAATSLGPLVGDQSVSPIVRATALATMASFMAPDSLAVVRSQLNASDPLLRLGAVQAFAGVPLPDRASVLIDRAQDESRAVRFAAAPLLAGVDRDRLTREQRRQVDALFAEYRQWLTRESDRAEALVVLAAFALAEHDPGAARASFEKALRRDETSLVAHLNYADYYRATGDDRGAEALLRRALTLYPDSAAVRFALGLLLVRQKQLRLAVPELRRAAELAPDNSYYAYVHAVGLHSSGQIQPALSALAVAQARFPANAQIRAALQAYCADGRGKGAC